MTLLLPFKTGSRPCDDESCTLSAYADYSTMALSVNFLYDLQTAPELKRKAPVTVNGQGGLPAPSPHAFVISSGKSGFDEMVKSIDEGLIVEQL